MTRRSLLVSLAAALAGSRVQARSAGGLAGRQSHATGIPLLHITDLYHPPQDPDDHIDLATVVALSEYDLRGVILDATAKFLRKAPEGVDRERAPGFVPVHQLSRILGRPIPVAAGPVLPLTRPGDDCRERSSSDQEGIRFLLDLLENSPEEIVISIVGSARVLTAALNRRPELVRSKVHSVMLNAGSLAGARMEWNVALDKEAYCGLWRSGIPIDWYPCATESGAFNPDHSRGTYWKTTHAHIFRDLAPSLQAWFTHAFATGTGGGASSEVPDPGQSAPWDRILKEERNMWSTASLVMGAGRVLAKTPGGWRFIPSGVTGGERIWPWRLDPIEATVDSDAVVRWRRVGTGGNARLFGRENSPEFGNAMSEALGALLGSLGK